MRVCFCSTQKGPERGAIMKTATTEVRFDETTCEVIVEVTDNAGTRETIRVGLDAAEAIFDTFAAEAGNAPKIEDPIGVHSVAGLTAQPFDGELHLYLELADGTEGIFVLTAPGKDVRQVETVSNAIRDAIHRLVAMH
jgi:hypothetical protein